MSIFSCQMIKTLQFVPRTASSLERKLIISVIRDLSNQKFWRFLRFQGECRPLQGKEVELMRIRRIVNDAKTEFPQGKDVTAKTGKASTFKHVFSYESARSVQFLLQKYTNSC